MSPYDRDRYDPRPRYSDDYGLLKHLLLCDGELILGPQMRTLGMVILRHGDIRLPILLQDGPRPILIPSTTQPLSSSMLTGSDIITLPKPPKRTMLTRLPSKKQVTALNLAMVSKLDGKSTRKTLPHNRSALFPFHHVPLPRV